jgi:hypothetical protein
MNEEWKVKCGDEPGRLLVWIPFVVCWRSSFKFLSLASKSLLSSQHLVSTGSWNSERGQYWWTSFVGILDNVHDLLLKDVSRLVSLQWYINKDIPKTVWFTTFKGWGELCLSKLFSLPDYINVQVYVKKYLNMWTIFILQRCHLYSQVY